MEGCLIFRAKGLQFLRTVRPGTLREYETHTRMMATASTRLGCTVINVAYGIDSC